MRRAGVLFLLMGIVMAGAGTAPGPATQAAAGNALLAGTIKSKAKVTKVVAVDRAWADVLKVSDANPKDPFVYEGTVNEKGEYRIEHLIAGRAYDLIVWTTAADGTATRWEGVSMDYHRAVTPSTQATADDRKGIESLIVDTQQFFDQVRVLRIAADHQHATVLVEQRRTRDFHSDAGGEVIYRVELWYLENQFGGWAKDANTERVVVRVRGKPGELVKNWQFLPGLGGLLAGSSNATGPATQAAAIELPDGADAKRGITGGIK